MPDQGTYTIILKSFNRLSQMRESDFLSFLVGVVRGEDSLLVFQKQLAPVASTRINCYLSDLDAFSLLSIPKKAKQKFMNTQMIKLLMMKKKQLLHIRLHNMK